MKLVGGDLGLDFVNTVGGRVPGGAEIRVRVRDDKIGSYADLVALSRHAAEASEARPARCSAIGREAARRRRGRGRPGAKVPRGAPPRASRADGRRRGRSPDDVRLLNEEVRRPAEREWLVPAGDGLAGRPWRGKSRWSRCCGRSPARPRTCSPPATSPACASARATAAGGCSWTRAVIAAGSGARWRTAATSPRCAGSGAGGESHPRLPDARRARSICPRRRG